MMSLKFLLTLSLIALSSARVKNRDLVEIEPKIVNGTDTQIERFPFVVSLQYVVRDGESWHSCGASILSSFWLLTVSNLNHLSHLNHGVVFQLSSIGSSLRRTSAAREIFGRIRHY